MRNYHREFIFESNDFEKMCKFIIEDNRYKREYFIWHIGRIVDWKYNIHNFKKHFPDNFSKAAHLWFNCFHELIGFTITEDFNNEFYVFLKDEYSYLYTELVDWFTNEWSHKYDSFKTSAVENQTKFIGCLEKRGFRKTDEIEMTRVFDTSHFRDINIDDSEVAFMNMSENKNYEEQRNLRVNAWPKTWDMETDLQIREYTRRSPIYNADFDFVLVNKEGKHVSGCEAFIDYSNNTAEIERVCTHSDYYNMGYAQKALKLCMKALYNHSINTAFISGSYDKTIYLYGKLGHVKELARYFYQLT